MATQFELGHCVKMLNDNLRFNRQSLSIYRALMLATVFLTANAHADGIRVELVGQVTSIEGAAVGNSFFKLGDPINYSVEFDKTLAESSMTARFVCSIVSFSGSVGTYSFTGDSGVSYVDIPTATSRVCRPPRE